MVPILPTFNNMEFKLIIGVYWKIERLVFEDYSGPFSIILSMCAAIGARI